jgi:predicted DNA-binding transcriptional regulator
MNKYLSLFSQIGIDEKSGRIYLRVLEYGRSPISEIVKNTRIHRVEVYRKLPYLLEIGLIKESKLWKRKIYLAASPQRIQELIELQKESSEKRITELIEKYGNLDNKPNVVYQEGAKAITSIFRDIVESLEKWDIFYRISSETNVEKSNSYLPKNYRELRDKKELERYVIMAKKTADNKKPRAEREVAIMPENYEQFDENIQMIVYKNKIAYIDYTNESAITIENKKMADFQKKLFTALFKSLKK